MEAMGDLKRVADEITRKLEDGSLPVSTETGTSASAECATSASPARPRPEWKDYGLVFPSRTGAPRTADGPAKGRLRPLLRRAGLPTHFTLYSLRYAFATLQYLASVTA